MQDPSQDLDQVMVSHRHDTSMTKHPLPTSIPLTTGLLWWCLTSTAMACATSPQPQALPLHAPGTATHLIWPAVDEATGYLVWMQWRVPEGPVVRTQEITTAAPEMSIPASPEPWRPLMLQVELISLCGKAPAGVTRSKPTLLRQLQHDPMQSCSPVTGLQPVRGAASEDGGPAPAPYQQLQWTDQPGVRVEITWFDGHDGKPVDTAEASSSQMPWSVKTTPPTLIRAVRSCSAGRQSKPTYLLVSK